MSHLELMEQSSPLPSPETHYSSIHQQEATLCKMYTKHWQKKFDYFDPEHMPAAMSNLIPAATLLDFVASINTQVQRTNRQMGKLYDAIVACNIILFVLCWVLLLICGAIAYVWRDDPSKQRALYVLIAITCCAFLTHVLAGFAIPPLKKLVQHATHSLGVKRIHHCLQLWNLQVFHLVLVHCAVEQEAEEKFYDKLGDRVHPHVAKHVLQITKRNARALGFYSDKYIIPVLHFTSKTAVTP